MSHRYEVNHDFAPSFQEQAAELFETATSELGEDGVQEIKTKVRTELNTNEWEIAVAFSDFTIEELTAQFGIQLDLTHDFFADVAPINVSDSFLEFLKDQIPLGLSIGTEKARSEFIIAPILAEVRRQLANRISIFSGVELNVNSDQGLRGLCDFLLTNSTNQLAVNAPILAVVEAKKEGFTAGIAQCLAEMVAARIFNQRHGNNIPTIYGIVTTGSTWKFLRLIDNTAYIDATEYYINELQRVVGIIVSMFTASGIALKA